MNVRFSPTGLYSRVSGTPKELNELENTLDRWAGQQAVGSGFMRVWGSSGLADEIWVLTGALLDLKLQCLFSAPPPTETRRLERAGLLRDYQVAAVEAACSAPQGRGIVEAPAGAGKTHIAAGIIACGAHLGVCEWAYLVQNRELAKQTERSFAKTIPKMLEVLGGVDVRVTCGSYGTIDEEPLRGAQGVIVDECHGLAARTRARALARARAARWKFGLSATPLQRQDAGNALVIGLLGPVVYSVDPKMLIEKGFLSKGRFHIVCL